MKASVIHTLLLSILLLLLFALGCTEIVDVELDNTATRLVVEGTITSDSLRQQVRLSKSGEYFSNESPPPVTGAIVQVLFSDSTISFSENPDYAGLYESNVAFSAKAGVSYELSIDGVDINGDGSTETYEAESTMPGGVELDYISLKYYSTPLISGYQVLVYASHTLYQRDFMGFRIFRNGILLTETLDDYTVFNDDIFDSGYFNGLPVAFLDDANENQALYPGDSVSLQLEVITQSYYDFIMEAQMEILGNNPLFSGPPSNIRSNLSNGALGFFTAINLQHSFATVE